MDEHVHVICLMLPTIKWNARTFWSSCQRHWEKLNLSKARKSHLPKVEIPSPTLSSPPTTASTETASGENSAGCPIAPSRKQPEPGPPATCPAPLAECQKSNAVTHSGRSIRPPGYSQDFRTSRFRPRSFLFIFLFYFSAKFMLNIYRIFPEHFREHLCEHFIVTVHCSIFFFTKRERCNVIMSHNRLSCDSS